MLYSETTTEAEKRASKRVYQPRVSKAFLKCVSLMKILAKSIDLLRCTATSNMNASTLDALPKKCIYSVSTSFELTYDISSSSPFGLTKPNASAYKSSI